MHHILPVNDIKEHEEESTCHCCPSLIEESGEMILVHNAFDQRELLETAFEKGDLSENITNYILVIWNLYHSREVDYQFFKSKISLAVSTALNHNQDGTQ